MTRTEDRLADALAAAARQVREEALRPLSVPPPRRWVSWLAPVAAAAGVLLVVGLAAVIGSRMPQTPPTLGSGQPRYYVEAGLCCGRPVVRSTATGAVTALVPVPVLRAGDVHGSGTDYGTDVVASARNRTFFVVAFVPGGKGQRIYRFQLTRSGRITGFAALPGGMLASAQWQADALAASPDGSRVAVAFYFTGSSRKPHPDYIAVVDTVTGKESLWRGGTGKLGPTFSVASLSWTGDGRELVFLGQWCRTPPGLPGAYNNEACGGGNRRVAEVRTLDPASGGGRLDSGRLLLGQSARFPYLAQALISPDGSTITAIALTGPAKGSHAVTGLLPEDLSVTQISVTTGRQLRVLYHRRLGPTSQIIGAPNGLILSRDGTGRYWMLDGGVSGGAGYSNGFSGWIDSGQLVPLPPDDGAIAGEAW